MNICNRLRSLRVFKGLTQKEVANAIGVSEMSVRCWENGSKNPSMSAIISLATLFGVSTDSILGVDTISCDIYPLTNQEITLLSTYRTLDSYGKKAVDTICTLESYRTKSQDIEKNDIVKFKKEQHARYIPRYITPAAAGVSVPLDGDDFDMIVADDSVPADADFAVIIQGDSMYPYINDGDTVYITRDCDLMIGDIGIFCVDGAMYCKQYYIDKEGNITLLSANPLLKHTNIHIGIDSGSEVRCYGKVLLGVKTNLPDYFSKG